MITIRLFRIGKKKQPAYKIVVTDKKNPPSGGRFIDEVGFYDPVTKKRLVDGEKVRYWVSKGASVSDTVYNFLLQEGIIDGKKKRKHNVSEKGEKVPAGGTDTKGASIKSDVKIATDEQSVSKEVLDFEEKG